MDLTILVPFTLALIMFSMGLSLEINDFRRLLFQPRPVIVALACQLILLPLIAYLTGLFFSLQDWLFLGLLLVALCPGGVSSNLASKYAGGDVALSISLTAFSSIFTVFSLPILMTLLARIHGIPIGAFSLPLLPVIGQLATLTILPLLIAMSLRAMKPSAASAVQNKILYLSTTLFVLVIALTWFQQWQVIVKSAIQIGLPVMTLNLLTMILGFFAGKTFRLPPSQRITLVLEVGLQNSVLAFTVAYSLMHNPSLAIPASFYSVVIVCSAIAVILLNHNTHKNDQ